MGFGIHGDKQLEGKQTCWVEKNLILPAETIQMTALASLAASTRGGRSSIDPTLVLVLDQYYQGKILCFYPLN